ncbi:hypothetical protein QBC41DRAFT_329668 [Cercophora samala]|uniref:Uncharacterized protein n=1 Tax=Cercophora samala TaxID=330535 RepID=A0AA39Z304_9PEZI|nr:hypothetical protein QBC41DRAFT_329668 [Cercophora samala]
MTPNAAPHEEQTGTDMVQHPLLQSLDTTTLCGSNESLSITLPRVSLQSTSATDPEEELQPALLPIRKPDYRFRRALKSWWAELASMALSGLVCLPIIVGILRSYDGRSLAEWALPVTPNAIIAFISTICRTAFIYALVQALAQQRWNWYKSPRSLGDFRVFDEAPGAIWGSFHLMIKMRGSPLGVTTCLILITSIVTSTLTQSALTYPVHSVPLEGNDSAVIMKNNGYLPGKTFHDVRDLSGHTFELRLKSSLMLPPFQAWPSQLPSCKSTNCTWPEFSTMEVCVNISDVSNLLQDVDEEQLPGGTNVDDSLSLTKFSLPNGVNWSANWNQSLPGDLAEDVGITAGVTLDWMLPDRPPDFNSLSFSGTDGQKAELMSLFIFRSRTRLVYEVLLHYCINRYSISTSENIVKSRRISSSSKTGLRDNSGLAIRWLVDALEPDNIYPIHLWAHQATSDKLKNIFSEKGSRENWFGEVLGGWLGTGDSEQVVRNISRNLAVELSNGLLESGNTSVSQVNGTAWQQEVRISVHWEWLALIVAQVCLSLIILMLVIIQTAELGLPVVKSSILPVFFAVGLADRTKIENEHHRGTAKPTAPGLTDEERDIGNIEKTSPNPNKKDTTTPKESYALLGELQQTKNGKWVLKSVYREG